jgi:hypothetical protein
MYSQGGQDDPLKNLSLKVAKEVSYIIMISLVFLSLLMSLLFQKSLFQR